MTKKEEVYPLEWTGTVQIVMLLYCGVTGHDGG